MSVAAFIKRSPWLRRGLWVPLQMRRFVKGRLERPYERAIDWLISSIEGDVALRVQQFGGTFQMSPHSDLFRRLVRYRSYEPKTAAFFDISVQPHKDIIDVGANIGFFTVLGARRLTIGRVLAIEPVETRLFAFESECRAERGRRSRDSVSRCCRRCDWGSDVECR